MSSLSMSSRHAQTFRSALISLSKRWHIEATPSNDDSSDLLLEAGIVDPRSRFMCNISRVAIDRALPNDIIYR